MVGKAISVDKFVCGRSVASNDSDVTPEKYFECRSNCDPSSEQVSGEEGFLLCHPDGASWGGKCRTSEYCGGANNDNSDNDDNEELEVSEKKTSISATTETTTTGINPTTIAIIGAVATLVVTVGYLVVREMGSNSGYKRRSLRKTRV